jgi:hypothetical protein
MKDTNSGTQNDNISTPEVIERLGNMYLVKINGKLKQVPATYKNKLLYDKKLYELLHPDTPNERVILTDNAQNENFIAIAPTNNDSVYQLWVDDDPHPVMNTPSNSEKVLRGVNDALSSPADYARLKNIYHEIRSNEVRRHVITKAESLFPRNEIIPTDEGWSILGLFILTWNSRVFLNTGEIEKQTAYRVRGSGVSETEQPREFLQLAMDEETIKCYRDTKLKIHYPLSKSVDVTNSEKTTCECPTCESTESAYKYYDENSKEKNRPVFVCSVCDHPWQEFKLTEREIEFIAKAQWLLNHREHLEDDAFWSVIESFVWHISD